MFDGIEFAKELPQQIKDYREFQKDLHHNGTYLLTTNSDVSAKQEPNSMIRSECRISASLLGNSTCVLKFIR